MHEFNDTHPKNILVATLKRLYDSGMTTTSGGNLSIRDENGDIWITPSGVDKGSLTREDIMQVKPDGSYIGRHRPSVEFPFHRDIYKVRRDISGIVHAHPPVSTAFAACRKGLETPYLAELVVGLGTVPCTRSFAMLSTEEVPESVVPYLPEHNAVLLANHGALTWGATLWDAFDRMETVEHTAKILMNIQTIGGGVPLTEEQVAQLRSMVGMYSRLREVKEEK